MDMVWKDSFQSVQRTVPTAAYDTRVRRRQPYVWRPLISWPVAVGGEGLGVVVRLYGPELSVFSLILRVRPKKEPGSSI